jgi:hypothetical protein
MFVDVDNFSKDTTEQIAKGLGAILDVGCGNEKSAKGSVNIDLCREKYNRQIGNQTTGEKMNPRKIPNFVVADACHLPFRDKSFLMSFSSHTIEHVSNPVLMFKELSRVSIRRVVIRCPHRRGSGAKRPFHINYLDEEWFNIVSRKLGMTNFVQFNNRYEGLSAKLPLPEKIKKTLGWRVFCFLERIIFRYQIPFDIEVWNNLPPVQFINDSVKFAVVTNNERILNRCFVTSLGVDMSQATIFKNKQNLSLPFFYNQFADSNKDSWLVFCHQDFILNQNLDDIVKTLDINAVYGVIGVREGLKVLVGSIKQFDSTVLGVKINSPEPVQTLDECCLIIHSSLFRKGLRFDEKFKFHFYGADICMQAFAQGFGVYALQIDCKHDSDKNQMEVLNNIDFLSTKKLFAKKWYAFLPVRTTCTIILRNENNSTSEVLLTKWWYKLPKLLKLKVQGTK